LVVLIGRRHIEGLFACGRSGSDNSGEPLKQKLEEAIRESLRIEVK
jgi:hypothetical protein